jgi:site-specific DNA-methyltransferase (adenine-specific)
MDSLPGQARLALSNGESPAAAAPSAGSRFELLPGRGSLPGAFSNYRLFERDAVDWLRSFEDESVDLVITDPPYESLEKYRAIGTTTRLKHSKSSSNDWFSIFPNSRFPELFAEVYRVLAKNRHFYLFCDQETMFVAKPIAEQAGFKFWKPLVWEKQRLGMGYHYRCRYEFVLFFEKGKRRLADLSVSDVITYPSVRGGYPTEKPSAVSEVFVRQSTSPGELVIDPFMGSGSVGVAALKHGRRFLGTDIAPAAVELTEARLGL